jgi:hypothetical protein
MKKDLPKIYDGEFSSIPNHQVSKPYIIETSSNSTSFLHLFVHTNSPFNLSSDCTLEPFTLFDDDLSFQKLALSTQLTFLYQKCQEKFASQMTSQTEDDNHSTNDEIFFIEGCVAIFAGFIILFLFFGVFGLLCLRCCFKNRYVKINQRSENDDLTAIPPVEELP